MRQLPGPHPPDDANRRKPWPAGSTCFRGRWDRTASTWPTRPPCWGCRWRGNWTSRRAKRRNRCPEMEIPGGLLGQTSGNPDAFWWRYRRRRARAAKQFSARLIASFRLTRPRFLKCKSRVTVLCQPRRQPGYDPVWRLWQVVSLRRRWRRRWLWAVTLSSAPSCRDATGCILSDGSTSSGVDRLICSCRHPNENRKKSSVIVN